MRNGDVDLGEPCRVIDACMEVPSRFKKLRLKLNVALNINRANRRSELRNLGNKLLLRRWRELPAARRTQPRCEEREIVLNGDALDRFPAKFTPFLCHGLLIGEEPPSPGADHREQDDQDNDDLARRVRSKIHFQFLHIN